MDLGPKAEMREIRTSGLMSGIWKRNGLIVTAPDLDSTAKPSLTVAANSPLISLERLAILLRRSVAAEKGADRQGDLRKSFDSYRLISRGLKLRLVLTLVRVPVKQDAAADRINDPDLGDTSSGVCL